MIKKVLVFIWNKFIDYQILCSNKFYIALDKVYGKIITPPKVKNIDQTIDYLISNRVSLSRFGDGELKLIEGKDIFFQKSSPELMDRLKEIVTSKVQNHIVGIPDIFGELSVYTGEPLEYWRLHIARKRKIWYRVLDKKKQYYNAFISRCYYAYKNKENSKEWFEKLKMIWKDREIVIIEGRKSRVGIGNDLFENTKSINRILCPEKNAFDKYEEIIDEIKKLSSSKLILLALGPTATILAYDLAKLGYQAIDIGHIDIEYEWFLMGATKKESIKNKFVGEVVGGTNINECLDINYLHQISTYVE